MIMNKIHRTICVITLAAAFCGFAGEAYAFGIPMPFKEYLASYMRSWTTSIIGKKKLTKYSNNLQLAQENAERGSGYEAGGLYDFIEDSAKRFGEDPKALEDASADFLEKTLKEYKKKAEEDAEAQKALEAENQQADNTNGQTDDNQASADDQTDSNQASAGSSYVKDQTYHWLEQNRSPSNKDGKIKMF